MRTNIPSTPPRWENRLRKEIRAARRVLVLAVGNPVKGDDGAGLACAKKLKTLIRSQARSRLKILLGYETPENLTGKIRKFSPGLVLILDAAFGPDKSGRIFIVKREQIQDEGTSTHRISLSLLVSYLEETVGCKVLILGIQPLRLNQGEKLSGPVEKATDRLAAYLARIFLAAGSQAFPG